MATGGVKDPSQYLVDSRVQAVLAEVVLLAVDRHEPDPVSNFASLVATVLSGEDKENRGTGAGGEQQQQQQAGEVGTTTAPGGEAEKQQSPEEQQQQQQQQQQATSPSISSSTHTASQEYLDACTSTCKLFKVKVVKEDEEEAEGGGEEDNEGGEGGAAEQEDEGQNEPSSMPDTLADLGMAEWAGLGFGRQEAMRLHLALGKLAKKEAIDSLRFWGKILGVERSYYVAEVIFKEGERGAGPGEPVEGEGEDGGGGGAEEAEEGGLPKDPGPVPREDPAEGDSAWVANANQFVYFVCHGPESPWTRLPDVKPAQIVAARKIRRVLTGDLTRKIPGASPPFPGLEREYLRAQIARIKHGASVCPQGYLLDETEEDAEEPTVSANAEYQPLPFDELKTTTLGAWVHSCREILPQGRCSFVAWPPPAEEEEEEEGTEKPPPYVEKNAPPLRSLHSDQPLGANGVGAWSIRAGSDLIPRYSCLIARSNRWPGANTIVFGSKIVFVYVGYGLKATCSSHVSAEMPVICRLEIETDTAECDDLHLQPPPPPEEAAEEAEE